MHNISDEKSDKEILLVDLAEKTFSWDLLFLEQDRIKHIFYNGRQYNVPWNLLKSKGSAGRKFHLAKLEDNLFVKWDGNLENTTSENNITQFGGWIRDTEETEGSFSERKIISEDYIDEPFVLIWHNPPNMPTWFDYVNSPQLILKRPVFQKSFSHCIGIITFSDYLSKWLVDNIPKRNINGKMLGVPIYTLKHPTEIPPDKFDFDKFMANKEKSLIQIGYWLRKMCFVGQLKALSFTSDGIVIPYKKIWLYGGKHALKCIQNEHIQHCQTGEKCANMSDVLITRLPNDLYDEMLTKNIPVLNLYDSSANNAVIECIVRHTPLLVNKHPAVVEYLGKDYPFYYDSLEEANSKIADIDLIRKTHEYLKNSGIDKQLSYSYFLQSFISCPIIASLIKKCK